MKHVDKLLFILALAVLVTAIIRFGVNRDPAPRTKTPAIVFTQWWEDYIEKEPLQDLVKEFQDTHGRINVILNRISYEDLYRELLGAEGEKTVPGDLFTLDVLWAPELMKRETMDFAWANSVGPQSPDTPIVSFINVLFYNVEILKEAGFSRPPKSRSEFINMARAVSGALGWALGSSRGIYDDVFPWIWAAGAELVKDGKPALNSRAVVESLSFLASLENNGFIAPGGFSAGAEKKLADFISGRTAFMIAPSRDIEFVRKHMGEQAFGVTDVPAPDNYAGKTFYAAAGWTLGINPASAHREEARLFAEFIAGKAQALSEIVMSGNRVQDPFHSKVWDIGMAGESARDFTGLPWEKLEEVFNEELSILFAGQASPAETASAIQKRWEAVISSYGSN